ncbi:MAG: hypothetical protein M1570_09635 [Chloroflexi bacterium]|nr:hypothetical protein [Chloroflexota bacterium]
MAETAGVEIRDVMRRGCGYPKPGGVYVECIGEPGGTLPIIVVLDPPIEHDHFHRGWVYIDLDAMLEEQKVKYVGTSLASAEEWHLRQKYQPIAQDVFGPEARLKDGQVLRFRETAARLLEEAGWQPGVTVNQAVEVLREHMSELAAFIDID